MFSFGYWIIFTPDIFQASTYLCRLLNCWCILWRAWLDLRTNGIPVLRIYVKCILMHSFTSFLASTGSSFSAMDALSLRYQLMALIQDSWDDLGVMCQNRTRESILYIFIHAGAWHPLSLFLFIFFFHCLLSPHLQ